MKSRFKIPGNQHGIAMITVLLLLIVLTLVVLSGSRITTMQLHMASNLESRVEALEFAQAGLDLVEGIDPTRIPVGINTICSTFNPEETNCDIAVDMPAPFDNTSPDGTSWLSLKRDDGLEGSLPRNMETSKGVISSAYFQAYSTYDNTKNGRGRADLAAGIMKLRLNDTAN
jgi:hypothetical protein